MVGSFKYGVAGIFVSALLIASASEALAWGCVAQANDGTYGYSYGFGTKKQAKRRAMAECDARTYDDCYITNCDPNS